MSEAQAASEIISLERETLAGDIVGYQYGQQPGVEEHNEDGREKSLQDVGYHLDYLAEALATDDPTLFAEYIAWAKTLFDGIEFPEETLAQTLTAMETVLCEQLAPSQAAVAQEYLAVAANRLEAAPTALQSFLSSGAPLVDLAREYLDTLLAGERTEATRLILDAVEEGTSVKDIYLHVFEPVQREIGRLWQMNEVTVAQEHFCTAATQLIMTQLYSKIFSGERSGLNLVATSVEGELHEIGIRMVADFFEMEGWDTYYLGANIPTISVLQAIKEHDANLLAISATISTHVGKVRSLIDAVRALDKQKKVKIMVGGYPFNLSPDLWQKVGADGMAGNARSAVETGIALVTGEVSE